MHIKGKYTWLKHLDFMIVDLAALIIAFVLAYRIKFGDFNFPAYDAWTRFLIIVSLLNIVISFFVNPYSGIFRRSYYQEIFRSLLLASYNLIAAGLIFYLFKWSEYYSRELFLYMYAIYFALSVVMKYIWKKLIVTRRVVLYTNRQIPLFIVGDREHIHRIVNNASAGDFQLYDIKGISLIDDDGTLSDVAGIPVIRSSFVDYILSGNISEVLIAVPPNLVDQQDYKSLIANGIGLNINIESAVGLQTEEQFITNIGIYKTMSLGSFTFTPGQMAYLAIKRVFDILFGLIGVLVLCPVSAGVKAANLLSGDTDRIFYRQNRVGMDGKEFRLLKFRSMVPGAGDMLDDILKDDELRKEWEENQKIADDPRVTKVGRFLRRASIDELPQFINVLKGDMSLVGPRPLVQGELEAHDGLKLYQKVKPGITGWWSCNGRSNIDYRERLELEYYYVKNCSLYLDILCILRTVLVVIKKEGAA